MPIDKTNAIQYQDEEGNWRVKLVAARSNITERARQEVYLAALAEHGRVRDAAIAAGVSTQSVNRLRQIDAEFDEACAEAQSSYRDRLIAHHQRLVFEGTKKQTFDRNGNLVSEEEVYPIRLIELELKKHDEGYRDKREVDVRVAGGVLVAPAEAESIDDWEARFSEQKTIEGEVLSSGLSDEDQEAQEDDESA